MPDHSITRGSGPADRPRVLHVYKDYYPGVLGGVETTINLLAEGCQSRFRTAVLVNSRGRKSNEETINGVRVVRAAEWGRVASAPVSPAFVAALRREAAQADLLHFHHPNPTGDVACLLTRPGLPCVMTYHSDVVRQQWAMAVYGPLQKWMMRRMDVIMPTSPNYLQSSEWLSGVKEKCRVVPLGIDMNQLELTPAVGARRDQLRAQYPGPLVLFVGRLRYYKGLPYLIEAMQSVDATLLIAGTGNMEAALRQQVASLNLTGKVVFLGDVSDEEKTALYHTADVFCMPSHLRSEAFGLSQLEAMACGLPVVSTNIESGVPYVNKHGESGLTVAPANAAALRDALTEILGDTALRQRLAQGAYQRAHTCFTATAMCENLMEVYDTLL